MARTPGIERTAMQGIWSGTISFSLVAIPVQLVRAVESGRVSFRMLHHKDYSPLARRMYCPEEEKVVPPGEIVRGYETAPGRYVLVSDEELESVSPERSRTIEITAFIDLQEVDPVFFDHPYYLVPSKGGEKAYGLLSEVMRRSNRAGLATFVLGEREYPVAVYSTAGVLALMTLHYPGEILPEPPPPAGAAEASEKVSMEKAVRKMLADFDPERYADRRRKKIMDLLRRKMKGHPPVEAPRAGEGEAEGPPDLMAALRESMLKVRKGR